MKAAQKKAANIGMAANKRHRGKVIKFLDERSFGFIQDLVRLLNCHTFFSFILCSQFHVPPTKQFHLYISEMILLVCGLQLILIGDG